MNCNCHLCKNEVEKHYWIMDMKFCENCFRAITDGDINKLKK